MGAILVKPANEEEYRLVTQLLKKMRVKMESFTEDELEEQEDIRDYEKTMKRIKAGKAKFHAFEDVVQMLEKQP
jgi:signal recognition particle GTPase